jgi:hypothetical protein
MKTIILAMLGIGLMVVSGCVAPNSEFVPPGGALFTHYKAPLLIDYNSIGTGQKKGEASSEYVYVPFTYGLLSFAWKDCSLNAACKDKQISQAGLADYEFFSVLGVYAKTTVHVYEAPVATK